MSELEEQLRRLVRDEIRRIVRSDAIADELSLVEGDLELQRRASTTASRLRRARSG